MAGYAYRSESVDEYMFWRMDFTEFTFMWDSVEVLTHSPALPSKNNKEQYKFKKNKYSDTSENLTRTLAGTGIFYLTNQQPFFFYI